MALGSELKFDRSLSWLERCYVRIFGVPINGLRIRARRILPLLTENYQNILDVGCGLGFFTFELARRFPRAQVLGIDIDPKIIERNVNLTSRLGLKNCRFIPQDITALSMKDQHDLVLSVDTLEHIQNDTLAIKHMHDALKVGGQLVVHVPAYERRWIFWGWKVNFDVDGHFRPGYTTTEIAQKIKSCGFHISRMEYTYGWLETVTNNISYLITGARMKNKHVYALVFPLLNFISFFGRNSCPIKGAGILIIARKTVN